MFYGLFCLSVGITSWFTVYKPIFKKLGERNEEIAEYYSGLIAFMIAVPATCLWAPVMLPLVLNGPDEEFTEDLIQKLMERWED